MIYFDVVSLFTNVPIDDAYCVALRRLEKDPELPDRTSLSPAKIVSLLEFVLRSTYFLYVGVYYEQTDGEAMGSPVSAVIANLYLESFEEETLQSCPTDAVLPCGSGTSMTPLSLYQGIKSAVYSTT